MMYLRKDAYVKRMTHIQKSNLLEDAGFRYSIDRMMYVNLSKKVGISTSFIEQIDPLVLQYVVYFTRNLTEEKIKELGGWGFYTVDELSDNVREELINYFEACAV